MRKLLTADRAKRLGNLKGGGDDVRKHKWFRGLDFTGLFNKTLTAPFVPETTGEFARWRHHNTAVTVVDIEQATGEVAFMKVNAAPHIYEADEGLLSGFPL